MFIIFIIMFIGNPQHYSNLVSWIQKPIESGETLHYKHICIVIGDGGIGKSYGIESAAKSTSKILYRLNDLDCNNSKHLRDLLYKITSSHIVSQIEKIENSQKIIWLDDFDSYIIFDRTFLHTLQDILDNAKIPAIKIIISTTAADVKHYTKFYNMGLIIKLKTPDSGDVIVFLRKTFPKVPVKIITRIADLSNGDLSSAKYMIELENSTSSTSKISGLFIKKSVDKFPQLLNLFDSDYDINDGRFIFDQDPWLHPLRFHENVLHELNIRQGLQINKNTTYTQILKLFCDWDQLMAYSKINDNHGMHIAIEIISHVPYYLQKFPKKKTAIASMDEFTRMFNYLSLKKKNAVALYIPDFPWITIGSYYKHLYDDKNKLVQKLQKTKKFST